MSGAILITANLCVLCVSALIPLRLFLTSLLPYLFVLSLPRRRGFRQFVAISARHPLIIRRRLFQQFLPRLHCRKIRRGGACPAHRLLSGTCTHAPPLRKPLLPPPASLLPPPPPPR